MELPSADLVRASLYADSLRDYIPAAWPLVEQRPFKSNWHIDAIAEHLQAVSDGEIKRLIINIPPRHMKSLGSSVFWPTWQWLRKPHTQFMFASYAQRLTARDSLKCRRVIESAGGRRVGGTMLERIGYKGLLSLLQSEWELAPDQREKLRFENTEFGYRLATSIGGFATGEGGDILVIDDPHKADEAESDVERENVIEWLDGTLSTRLNDPTTGAIVVVMQRLHEDDATGHLLRQSGYEHLCLPAEYEPDHPFVWPNDPRTKPGELLWPEHFNAEKLAELKLRLGTYRTAGQLQQRPAPAEGFLFKRKNFRYWQMATQDIGNGALTQRWYVLPDGDSDRRVDTGHCVIFQSVDAAISEEDSADYTVVATWAVTPALDLLLLDLDRQHFEDQEIARFLMRCSDKHNRPPMWIEKFGAGRNPLGIVSRAGYPITEIPDEAGTKVDKITRAFGAITRYEAHKVFHPERASWLADYEHELTSFPNASHDDMVDVTSYAARLLAVIGVGERGSKSAEPTPPSVSAGIMSQQF